MDDSALFENKYRLDYATFVKVYRIATGRRRKFFLVFGGVMLLLAIMLQILGEPVDALVWILLLCLLIYLTITPLLSARYSAKQHLQVMNGVLEDATATYTDADIMLRVGQNESHLAYSQLTRVVNQKDCWMLLVSRTVMIPVSKDRFTKGSAADFPAFIREKCPQIKGQFN